ncbi:MAG: 50S ribosomal protein L17 [Flavobacteriales bacterium]|nr:50S ribosomal protein L17 [Flavobacteriales bacterium]
MRHRKKFNHLGRKAPHRRAMLSNMACSLIEHKRINTTVAKAKALRVYIEPLLTKSKEDSTHNRRQVFSYLQNKYAIAELFKEIAPKIQERNGGYTRIIKTGFRQGDGADTALIELVDFNELYSTKEVKKTRRSRRAGKPTAESNVESVNNAPSDDDAKTAKSETTSASSEE